VRIDAGRWVRILRGFPPTAQTIEEDGHVKTDVKTDHAVTLRRAGKIKDHDDGSAAPGGAGQCRGSEKPRLGFDRRSADIIVTSSTLPGPRLWAQGR
jgi:hypothetical protein